MQIQIWNADFIHILFQNLANTEATVTSPSPSHISAQAPAQREYLM